MTIRFWTIPNQIWGCTSPICTSGTILWICVISFVDIFHFGELKCLVKHFQWRSKLYSLIKIGSAPGRSRHVVGSSTVLVRTVLIRTLYVGFIRDLTSTASFGGILNCISLSKEVDSIFSPFVIKIFALFSTPCTNCLSHFTGLSPLPLSISHIATLCSSIVSLGLSLILPLRIFNNMCCGGASRLRRDQPSMLRL